MVKISAKRLTATPAAAAAFNRTGDSVVPFLHRHTHGDWGEVDPQDHATNDQATVLGGRVLSAYSLSDGTKIWIITEADRSVTTILLPEEY